jgi:hypothetical protein
MYVFLYYEPLPFFFLSFSMTVYFGETTASAGPPGY